MRTVYINKDTRENFMDFNEGSSEGMTPYGLKVTLPDVVYNQLKEYERNLNDMQAYLADLFDQLQHQ